MHKFRDTKSKWGPFRCGDIVRDPRERLGYKGGPKRIFVLCKNIVSAPATDEAIYLIHKCAEHGIKRYQNVKPIHGEDLLDYTMSVDDANLPDNKMQIYLEKTDHQLEDDRAVAVLWREYTGQEKLDVLD